jgi:hypothetical protein
MSKSHPKKINIKKNLSQQQIQHLLMTSNITAKNSFSTIYSTSLLINEIYWIYYINISNILKHIYWIPTTPMFEDIQYIGT